MSLSTQIEQKGSVYGESDTRQGKQLLKQGNSEDNLESSSTQQPSHIDMPDRHDQMADVDNYRHSRDIHCDDNDTIDRAHRYSKSPSDQLDEDHDNADMSHDNKSGNNSDSSSSGDTEHHLSDDKESTKGKSEYNIKRRWRNLYANSQKSTDTYDDSEENIQNQQTSQSGPPNKRVKDTLFQQITARQHMKNMPSDPQDRNSQAYDHRNMHYSSDSNDQDHPFDQSYQLDHGRDQSHFSDVSTDITTDRITTARLEQSIKLLSGDIGLKLAHKKNNSDQDHMRNNSGSKSVHYLQSGCDKETAGKTGSNDNEHMPVLIPLNRFFNQNRPVDYSKKDSRSDSESVCSRGEFTNIPTASSPDKGNDDHTRAIFRKENTSLNDSSVVKDELHNEMDKQQARHNYNQELSQLREDCSAAVKAFKRICQEESTKSKGNITNGGKKEIAKCILKSLKHKMIHSLFDKVISLEYGDENEEIRSNNNSNELNEPHAEDSGDDVNIDDDNESRNSSVHGNENEDSSESTPSHDFHLKQLLFAQDGSLQNPNNFHPSNSINCSKSINDERIPSPQSLQLHGHRDLPIEVLNREIVLPKDCSANEKSFESQRECYGYQSVRDQLSSNTRKVPPNDNFTPHPAISETNTVMMQHTLVDISANKPHTVVTEPKSVLKDQKQVCSETVSTNNIKNNSKPNSKSDSSHCHSCKKTDDVSNRIPRKRSVSNNVVPKEVKSCKAEFNMYRPRFFITKSELDRIIQEVYAQDENSDS